MTTQTEALKLALEALEVGFMGPNIVKYNQAITAIKEALSQPEQEPVAGLHAVYFQNNWDGEKELEYRLARLNEKGEWICLESGASLIEFEGDKIIKTWPLTFESATPPQRTWVGLTDEELQQIVDLSWRQAPSIEAYVIRSMQYAEAKLKEKNT